MENIKQWSPHRDLFISIRKEIFSNKNPQTKDKMFFETKERVRESVMQGKDISTPHIHRTRWEPFGLCVCVCVFEW